MHRYLALALFILAAFVVAGIGGAATASSVGDWYPTLAKPAWNPPGWVFGPAWTLLYLLMSIAVWRAWLRRDEPTHAPAVRALLWLHAAQLGLNALWSILFFGLRRPDLALIEILLLLGLLVVIQKRLCPLDRPAAWLWLPYLAWVTFATTLNTAIWWLNR